LFRRPQLRDRLLGWHVRSRRRRGLVRLDHLPDGLLLWLNVSVYISTKPDELRQRRPGLPGMCARVDGLRTDGERGHLHPRAAPSLLWAGELPAGLLLGGSMCDELSTEPDELRERRRCVPGLPAQLDDVRPHAQRRLLHASSADVRPVELSNRLLLRRGLLASVIPESTQLRGRRGRVPGLSTGHDELSARTERRRLRPESRLRRRKSLLLAGQLPPRVLLRRDVRRPVSTEPGHLREFW
jgi:hypothetical protein